MIQLQPHLAMAQEPLEHPVLEITHGWESLCESPGFQHRSASTWLEQKGTALDASERIVRTVWLYLCYSSPQPTQLKDKGGLLSLWLLPWKRWEHLSGHLASPAIQDTAKEAHFSLTTVRVVNQEQHDLRGRKRRGDWQIGLLEGIKGTQIFLTASWTPSRRLSISPWQLILLSADLSK